MPVALKTGLHVALLRRFFSERLDFLRHTKGFVEVQDFHELGRHSPGIGEAGDVRGDSDARMVPERVRLG